MNFKMPKFWCMWAKREPNKIKLAKEILRLPLMSLCAVTRASGRETCSAAWPSVCLFTRWTQSESVPLGFPAPRLPHCVLVFSRAAVVPRSDGAIHHTSTHQDASEPSVAARADVREQSNNHVGVSVSGRLEDAAQYWEIKTNVLQDEINNRLQVELFDAYFYPFTLFSFFSFHIFSLLLSLSTCHQLVLLHTADGPWLQGHQQVWEELIHV